jgi:carboxyl-terminal processing protease
MLSLAVALAIVLSGTVGFVVGDDGGGSPSNIPSPNGEGFDILDEIYDILGEDFVNPDALNQDQFEAAAINGVLQALGDPHTVYIDPQSYALGIDIISGTFDGIGAQVERDPVTGEIVILTPFRDSPAEKAGVRVGDVITAVDGDSTEGWTVTDAVRRIRGEQGTNVTLSVIHSDGDSEEITIERGTIVIPTVFTRSVSDSAGSVAEDLVYIELQQFTQQTVEDLRDELNRIDDEEYGGLILDLRGNPGGSLDATVEVANMFLDGGLVLTQIDRDGNETRFEARSGGEATDIPMVILVGPGSASGSEVVAGALRDNGRATLIGERTFGKGSVNHLRDLSDGGALYVTIARWITPNGEQIEGVGLLPDIVVEMTEDEALTREGPQLFTAIDFLRGDLTQAP